MGPKIAIGRIGCEAVETTQNSRFSYGHSQHRWF